MRSISACMSLLFEHATRQMAELNMSMTFPLIRSYAVRCIDNPAQSHVRSSTRAAHLEWALSTREIRFAGPLSKTPDDIPLGSLLLVQAQNVAHAEQVLSSDPYAKQALFQDVELYEFQCTHSIGPIPNCLHLIWRLEDDAKKHLRQQLVSKHMAWWTSTYKVGFLGSLLSTTNGTIVGSLIVCNGIDKNEVESWARTDPYYKADLIQSSEIHAFAKVIENGGLAVKYFDS